MDSIFDTLKNLGPGRLAMMVVTFFGLIIFFIFIAMRSGTPSLTLLYGDLSISDATEISAKLDASNIPYLLNTEGTQVSVPQKDVGRARMLLAADGLPHQGSMGYEIFDKDQGFGTTTAQQNLNELRALEGEIARTIGTIDNIRSARVKLVLPERQLFSRETQPATASVFLNIKNAAAIGKEQIQAIQHLVAGAVPQLKAANVTIIDQNGTLLASGEDDPDSVTAQGSDDMKQKYESRLGRQLEDMVGRIVGFGKVRATVSADLNFDVVSRNSESYNPDQQVVRSTQETSDESQDSTGGASSAVTVQNNLPGLPAQSGATGGGSNAKRTETVTNFEIGKIVENTVRQSGEVKKLSIAVLVDGAYVPDTAAEKPADAPADWAPPKKYTPRSQEELDKISALVKSAVGFDESRGDTVEVVNMQFAAGDEITPVLDDGDKIMGFARADVLNMAETLALSIVAVLIILLVLRPLATHFTSAPRGASNPEGGGMTMQGETALLMSSGGAQAQLAPPGSAEEGGIDSMIDMSAVEGKVKASSVQKISELVTNHPNETISVIRQWMSQES